MIRGFQNTRPIVGVKAERRLTSAGINNGPIRGREGNRAHRERRVLVPDRGPSHACIRRAPNAAHRAAYEYGIPRRIGRIDRDGHDPAGNWRKEASGRGSRPDGSPGGGNRVLGGEPRLRSGLGVRPVWTQDQLAFRFHHSLHVSERLKTRAGGNAAIYRTALLVKPFVAFANLFRAVFVRFGGRSSVEVVPVIVGRCRCGLLFSGRDLRPTYRCLAGRGL